MKQFVKIFTQGLLRDGTYRTEPLDEQLDTYLTEHPEHRVHSFSMIVGNQYREVFVVFDIYEDRSKKKENQNKTHGYQKQNNQEEQNNG